MNTIQEIIYKAAIRLRTITDSPQREACLLLAHALDLPYEEIYFAKDTPIGDEDVKLFLKLIDRRLNHEPLSKIRAWREFWSLRFRVTADTLDPRPDSEALIESVLDYYQDKNQTLRILDLGTGTGCLLLSLLHEYPNATGVGVDLSEAAGRIAQENAQNLNLGDRATFIVGNWGDAINGSFDIILSNPPYISQQETLPNEVKAYDPPLSLNGGEDGLDAYRALVNQVSRLATPYSKIFLEVGATQFDVVRDIFVKYTFINKIKDLQGKNRGLVFCMFGMPVD